MYGSTLLHPPLPLKVFVGAEDATVPDDDKAEGDSEQAEPRLAEHIARTAGTIRGLLALLERHPATSDVSNLTLVTAPPADGLAAGPFVSGLNTCVVEGIAAQTDARVVSLGKVLGPKCYEALDSSALRFTAAAYELLAPVLYKCCVE